MRLTNDTIATIATRILRDIINDLQLDTAACSACTSGTLAGKIPGVLGNGERCDVCLRYASDHAAAKAIHFHDTIAALFADIDRGHNFPWPTIDLILKDQRAVDVALK